MLRKVLVLFILFLASASVYAGSYEDALKKSDYVFLYFYSEHCSTCKIFDSIYNSIRNQNKEYAYVKVNADTPYGTQLIYRLRGRYVPYIVLKNAKTNKSVNISHTCVMNEICLLRAMNNFKG